MNNNTTVKTPTIYIRGVSGNTYQFLVYDWDTLFTPISAVYLVLRQQLSGNFSLIYAGQASDMSKRLDSHKLACFEQYHKTHIGVSLENSEVRRFTIEADIIAAHHPVCND